MNENKEKTPRPPKLQKFMHPRNPYKIPPSFKKLAMKYSEFRKFCTYEATGKVHLNFQDPSAVATLTKCLLKEDFELDVKIPDNTLVPTLPLRFNYLLWIQDLMNLVYPKLDSSYPIIGCDIGTGASCIYPILGVKHFNWSFLATDTDPENIEFAQENVTNNNLSDSINIQHIKNDQDFFKFTEDATLQPFLKHQKQVESTALEKTFHNCSISGTTDLQYDTSYKYLIDFSMCNPPFFSSETELDSNAKTKRKRSQPNSAPTGKNVEKITDGGEVMFIDRLIKESKNYKTSIRIFSSLIGKKEDIRHVKQSLISSDVAHFKFTEFCQGRTMRWGVAWTYDESITLEYYVSKKEQKAVKPILLPIPKSSLPMYNVAGGWKLFESILKEIKIKPKVYKSNAYFLGADFKAYKTTWLHQRRKKREEKRKLEEKERISRKRTVDDNEYELPAKRCCLSPVNTPVSSSSSLENSREISMEEESEPVKSGLVCLLKCQIHITCKNGIVQFEFIVKGGTKGKESCQQIVQYMRNKI